MPRITLRNHKVHYQQIGSGPDIVLLHGLSCHIAFWWFHVAQQLGESHRVTAVDLRGHGFTGMTESGYRPCDLAKDVEALLEHLGIERTHLLGHSFGGAVAAAIATERPDLVSEVTLADAWLPSLQPVPPLLSGSDWSATLERARTRGIAVEPNLPLVVRSLIKEMLDEHEFQAKDVYSHNTPSGEPTWEDTNWLRARGRLVRFGRGGSRLGRTLWSPLNSRAGQQGRMNGTQEDAVDRSAATERDGTSAPMVLQRAMLVTGKPGKSSLAVRRWQELMRWTNARVEYLDTTGIDADALGDISAPVRLVYGARSLYRPSAMKMKKLLPHAHLRIVPRAGHCFPLLRPQGLLEAMATPVPGAQDAGPTGSRQRVRLVFSGRAETADLHRRELGEPAWSTSGSPRP